MLYSDSKVAALCSDAVAEQLISGSGFENSGLEVGSNIRSVEASQARRSSTPLSFFIARSPAKVNYLDQVLKVSTLGQAMLFEQFVQFSKKPLLFLLSL